MTAPSMARAMHPVSAYVTTAGLVKAVNGHVRMAALAMGGASRCQSNHYIDALQIPGVWHSLRMVVATTVCRRQTATLHVDPIVPSYIGA